MPVHFNVEIITSTRITIGVTSGKMAEWETPATSSYTESTTELARTVGIAIANLCLPVRYSPHTWQCLMKRLVCVGVLHPLLAAASTHAPSLWQAVVEAVAHAHTVVCWGSRWEPCPPKCGECGLICLAVH